MKSFLKVGVAFCMIGLAACSSQQKSEELEYAREESSAINSRAKAAIHEEDFRGNSGVIMRESTLPLLGVRQAPVERTLPAEFSQKYFWSGTKATPLIDVLKKFSGDTGLMITAREDVYVPVKEESNEDDADVEKEDNLAKAGRTLVPAGSKYRGDVRGFLNYLSSLLNVSWEFLHDENRVLMSRYVEESYRLFVPESNAKDEGVANIWRDTTKGIESLLSSGGQVNINQQAGFITVVDTKDVQTLARKHIDKINRSLAKSVVFHVEVLSVELTDEFSAGTSIDILSTINEGAGAATRIKLGDVSIPGSSAVEATVLSGGLAASKLIQQNLSKKGEVSVSQSRIVRTMNNQGVDISQINTIPVLSSFTPSTTNSDGVSTNGAANTTDVEVGFRLKLIPAVLTDGQQVVVRMEMETSELLDLVNIPISDNGQIIQSARTSKRTYNHSFALNNSQTVLVAGFNDQTNSFKQQGPFDGMFSWLFGSIEDKAQSRYYVILITPKISNGQTVI